MKNLRDVRIVAWFFIGTGVLSVASALWSGRIEIGTGLLAIPTGIGLLHFRSGWRTVALICLWVSMIGFSIGSLGMLSSRVSMDFFGFRSDSKILVLFAVAACFSAALWQYRVLTRFEVRRWFDLGEPSAV